MLKTTEEEWFCRNLLQLLHRSLAATEMATEAAYRATTRKLVLSVPVCWDECSSSSSGATAPTTTAVDPKNVSCSSSIRKPFRKEVQCTLSLCIGVLLLTAVIFLMCAHDLSSTKVSEASQLPWRLDVRPQLQTYRPWRTLQASSSSTTSAAAAANNNIDRRSLLQQQQDSAAADGSSSTKLRADQQASPGKQKKQGEEREEAALEGMGTLFRRGKRAMSALLVAHLSENTTAGDLRLFLRTLHRSGTTARADVVLLFPWRPLPAAMLHVIQEEEESFHMLLKACSRPRVPLAAGSSADDDDDRQRSSIKLISYAGAAPISVFNAAAFWKLPSPDKSRTARSIWGNNHRSHHYDDDSSAINTRAELGSSHRKVEQEQDAELRSSHRKVEQEQQDAELGSSHRKVEQEQDSDAAGAGAASAFYGAIVGFDMQELDPADALRAFVDEAPAGVRRWVCYQILLGMLRQKYRHVMLSEVTGLLILKDVLAPLKKKDTGLYVFAKDRRWNDDDDGDRRRRDNEQHRRAGLIEKVYGKRLWDSLPCEEKRSLRVISSGVAIGGMKSVRTLAGAVATEVVRVAIARGISSREPFRDDQAVLSYLVHKSSVLGRKTRLHLVIPSADSSGSKFSIRMLSSGSKNFPSNRSMFFGEESPVTTAATRSFAVIQGYHYCSNETRNNLLLSSLHHDICKSSSSSSDSPVYRDCV